jgi:hypothetical protein
MQLQIDDRELDLLVDVLRSALGSLREEIYKTEAADFETQLKQRKVVLMRLLTRLEAARASGLAVGEPTSRR